MIKAVIPAAGLGTRFLPATKASPKEMLPLVDKPLIQYVVEEAVAAGIEQIILVTGRGKRTIEDHFDVSFELEANLKENGKREALKEIQRISKLAEFCYVRQSEAKGLGHAILSARHLVGNEPFAVLLGDDIIDSEIPALSQLMKLYRETGSPVIGIQEVAKSEVGQYGIIEPQRVRNGVWRVLDLIEKPQVAEAPSRLGVVGRYLLPPMIFGILEHTSPGRNGEIQLTDALKKLARKQTMYGCTIQGKRYDAGNKLGFLIATVEFGLKNPELGKQFRSYLKSLKV
ncbi:MAG TPA: UTP--glucose-1-phosphate uridylyltransferase GalU [Nitrospiria bacterium]|nr:UTP--glucose-1-phosphate uridylyltransferase GalU [Nitrospiria bacterium]